MSIKINNIGGLTTGAGMAEPHSLPPEEQGIPGSILDEAPFFSIVDFQDFAVRLSKVCSQVHQGGGTSQDGDHQPTPIHPIQSSGRLTTGAGMAEPHGPPPKEQPIPGSILDAPFFSIVDFQRLAVRLSKVRTEVHQAGGTGQYGDHYTPHKAKCIHTVHYHED